MHEKQLNCITVTLKKVLERFNIFYQQFFPRKTYEFFLISFSNSKLNF